MFQETEIVAERGTVRFELLTHFHVQAATAEAELKQFMLKFQNGEEVNAMRWADAIFVATAKKWVAEMVVYQLKHFTDLKDVVESLQRSVLDKARYVHNKSTSVSSNYLSECELSAVTQAYEVVKSFTKS